MEITGIPYEEYKKKFGTVLFEGKLYWLMEVADFSNRVFNGWWGDAQEGETYTVEFQAKAVDSFGEYFEVVWQFDDVKGEEQPPDGYPWDDDHIVRVVSL